MLIHSSKLIHLPVFTESGIKLGQVSDIEIDIDTHAVKHYIVGHRFIGKDSHLVSPIQVKSITEEKMIVDDILAKDVETKTSNVTAEGAALGGVSPIHS